MYDPDLHTWGEDTLAIVRDAEIDEECPAGGPHTWVDNSTENSDTYHARPGEGAHCDECGAPRRDDTR